MQKENFFPFGSGSGQSHTVHASFNGKRPSLNEDLMSKVESEDHFVYKAVRGKNNEKYIFNDLSRIMVENS